MVTKTPLDSVGTWFLKICKNCKYDFLRNIESNSKVAISRYFEKY